MLQKIFLLLALISCIAINATAKEIPNPFDIIKQKDTKSTDKIDEPKDIIQTEEKESEEIESRPFIETGNIVLPISPEVLQSMAEKEAPPEIIQEKIKEEVKEEIEEEEEIEKTYDKEEPKIVEEAEESTPAQAEPKEEIETKEATVKKEIPREIPSIKIPDQPKPKKIAVKPKQDVKLLKFIKDESILILFKDDDVILGKLTTKAKLDQMNFSTYLKLHEENNKKIQDQAQKHLTQKFIAKHSAPFIPLSKQYLRKEIKKEIADSSLNNIRIFVDNYDILNMSDSKGNNMLHLANIHNDFIIAKWLVMKGIKLNHLNKEYLAPIDLALLSKNWIIFDLLDKAGAK